jgi:hypothetical protein
MQKSMLLVTAPWKNTKTFKLIPISADCPYNEMIYDRQERILAIIGKEKKQSLHMLTKLNDQGDPIPVKSGRRANGNPYAEERKTLETFYEYYVENPEEIQNMINMFAFNADTFEFQQYLELSYSEEAAS